MSRNECVDRVMNELELYGLRGEVIDRTKHIEIAWNTSAGRRFVITSKTASDWRSSLNIRGDVRRLLRADNLQPKAISELSFQKAMSLPKPVVPVEHILQKDMDAITDIIFELQSQITTVLEQNTALQQMNSDLMHKLTSARVVSTIQFGASPVSSKSEEEIIEAIESYQPSGPFRPGSKSEMVINLLTAQFSPVAELIKKSGLTKAHVSNILAKAKNKGIVENGLRGMWRRKA